MNGENLAALEEFSDDEDAYAHDLFDDGFIIADDDYEQLSETSYENLDDGERMPKNLNRYQLKKENARRLNAQRKAMVSQKNLIIIELCDRGSKQTENAKKPMNILTNLQDFEAISLC